MTVQSTILKWRDESWLAEVRKWVKRETEKRSITINGEFEQSHAYAWSTVMRIPTHDENLFFKATADETLFEAGLTKLLVEIARQNSPDLIAADAARGWMLMRDGGGQLRERIRPTKDIGPWRRVVPQFAELQIRAAAHVQNMLEAGVPDYRLEKLPGLLSALLKDRSVLLLNQPKGITEAELNELLESAPRFQSLCEQLSAYDIPETLNHGDFHDGNVLIQDDRLTFIDWGDASVSHPFVTLRTLFVSMEITLDLEDHVITPEMSAVLDEYLKPWQRFAPMDQLKAAYQLSKPVASAVKALNWYVTVAPLRGNLRAEYEHIVPAVLKEFLHHMEKTAQAGL